MMNLLIKFPTRSRPHKFLQVLSAYQKLRTLDTTRFLITIDEDDHTMNNGHILNVLKLWGNVEFIVGESKGKIGAVNRDMDKSGDWDVVLLASDDMIPQVQGYDDIILKDMACLYPDTDGVLWYNDGYVGSRLNTLCILGRKYYERFGYIYHPDYTSLWADNEFMEVANSLGKQTYIDKIIIKHVHPMNAKGVPIDSLYKMNERFYEQDKLVYERRKLKNFEIHG